MVDSRKRRGTFFLFFLVLFGAVLGISLHNEQQRCLGIEILSKKEEAALQDYVYLDFSRDFLHNGQNAAVDTNTSTIYIAQDITPDTKIGDLRGNLKLSSSTHWIAFAPDAAFQNLAEAVAENHSFKLYAINGSGQYMSYNVVFTTLPVLRLDGDFSHYNEVGREVNRGTLCLWTPADQDTGRYSVKHSNLEWHIRGNTSAWLGKTPWKLSLKEKNGSNNNMSFLGMGEDDDWILNSMGLDDTKLKEKIFMGLWNQHASRTDWNQKMSAGEYVELVMNRQYMGLYQLQRRIDDKYLALESEDILLKGRNVWEASVSRDAYEIIYSPLDEERTYALADSIFAGTDAIPANTDSFLDVSLFIQYASAVDNVGYKNMFYLLKKTDNGYCLYWLPWDTDMSWGVVFQEGTGFAYDKETSITADLSRIEYAWMKQYHPDLDDRLAQRWFSLREELFSEESTESLLEKEWNVLQSSGAWSRDSDCWGLYYHGEDSVENLRSILRERLQWLDDYYQQYQ